MKLKRPLVLASSSPRRQYLMREAGFEFHVEKPEVDEVYPEALPVNEVARYLAAIKAESFRPRMTDHVILTADTVVILDNTILNKPSDRDEAIRMLSSLSGNTHRVMTGVSILSEEKEENFDETTEVTFEKLSRREIELYIDHFKPYDKAGSYGAQDCLPPGMNPCSEEEMLFLRSIGKETLIKETITSSAPSVSIVLVKDIDGSYFNVMGLPIHKIYERLMDFSLAP